MSNPFEETIRVLDGNPAPVKNLYMVNKILSFLPLTAIMSIKLNSILNGAHPDLIQKMFRCFPRKRSRYLRLNYARKKKELEPKLVERVCRQFCVNKYHADQIIDLYRLYGQEPEKFFGLKKGE